mmetsp:Transcript_5221/g.18623  ORF Transcript_5221/g.18623 Transcript_5221/m.18623 type:complete len:207 (-) Transcript_5221:126-746(-)
MSFGDDRTSSLIHKFIRSGSCLSERNVRVPAGLEIELLHKCGKLGEGICQAIILLGIFWPRLHYAHLGDHVAPQADHSVGFAEEERDPSLPQPVCEEEEMFLREVRHDDAGEVVEEVQVTHDDLARILVDSVPLDLFIQLQQVLHDLMAARLADAFLGHEKVVSEIPLANTMVINDGECSDSGQDKVFQHFSGNNCGIQHANMPLL